MNVSSARPQIKTPMAAQQQPPQKPEPPKSDADSMVETIVDNTYLSANFAASGLTGAFSGTGAFVTTGLPEAVKTGASIIYNVARTEKIGPTLKTLALAAALPVTAVGAAIAAPVSLLAGVWQGAGEVDTKVPRQFTVGQAAKEAYTEVRGGIKDFAGGIKEEMKELGDYKLKPGEKAIDIPLIQLGKTLIMGAVGAAVGGIAGAVSAIASTASEAGRGVVNAFTDSKLNVGEKLFAAGTSVVSAPIHGTLYGARTALGTFGNALATTWDKDSMTEGARSIFNNSVDGMAAAFAPETVLTMERPKQQ